MLWCYKFAVLVSQRLEQIGRRARRFTTPQDRARDRPGGAVRLRCLLILFVVLGVSPAPAQDAPQASPAVDVAAVEAKEIEWQEKISSIGVAEALQGVNVSGSEAGTVADILFDSGAQVTVGQVLVRLDTSKEQADLAATQAQIPAAQADLDRKRKLVRDRVVSQSDLDQSQSRYDELIAESISLKATIERRSIRAPFGGILGIRKVNRGQYLQPGDEIVSLQDLTVMRMRFLIGQKDFAKIKLGQEIEARFDAYPGQIFKGRISAIEPSVKYTSGIIPIQAEIPNSDLRLLPGMYASLDILLPDRSRRVVVPQSAVTFNLYGETAYVVDPNTMVVNQVTVRTGARRDNIVVIESGIAPGQKVVVAGQLKISNGTKVNLVDGQTLPEMTEVPVQ
jgi:membrane fusion protein, multidrug efflux system